MIELTVKNLQKSFRKNKVLKDINLTIHGGNIIGLIGENGAGKSTLIKILSGLLKPDSGDILAKGINFSKDINGIIEEPKLYPNLNAIQNIICFLSLYNVTKNTEKIEKILKIVNLHEEMFKKTKNYSLGMKQKLSIAQILLLDSKILVLDEPFNGLDLKTTIKVKDHLLTLKRKGYIVIIASHILPDLDKLCDHIYILNDGKIVKDTKDLPLHQNKYNIKTSNLSKTIVILQRHNIEYHIIDDIVCVQCELHVLGSLLIELDNIKVKLLDIYKYKDQIEDIYLKFST